MPKNAEESEEKPISVLHLLSSLGSGGIERLIVDFTKEASSAVSLMDVSVMVMNNFVDDTLREELVKGSRRVYFLNRKPGHISISYIMSIFRIIRSNHIKIVHAHNRGSKLWGALCKLLKPGIRLFYTTHDTLYKKKGVDFIELFIHRYAADCNIAISSSVLEMIRSYRFRNCHLVYNGIDLDKFKPIGNREGKPSGPIKIIQVARVEHAVKGQDILIKAVKLLKNRGFEIMCTFAGSIGGRFKESHQYLVRMAEDLGISDSVVFLGDRGDIPHLLADNDIFVLPSRYEGLGLAILEAMASGVPVVASNLDGPSELIKQRVNGLLFEAGNVEELAGRIYELHQDEELKQSVITNGVEFAKGFGIELMCRRYETVYRQFM